MRRQQPVSSWQNLRLYTEKWQWIDPVTRLATTGYSHPQTAINPSRKPFFIRYVTRSGRLECGNAVVLRVRTDIHQRMIQFVESQEIRWVCDCLVIEVDGTRFVTH